MRSKFQVALSIATMSAVLLGGNLALAQSPAPIDGDVRAIMTAVSGGADPEALLSQLAESLDTQAALVDSTVRYADLGVLRAAAERPAAENEKRPDYSTVGELGITAEEVSKSPADFDGRAVCWRSRLFNVLELDGTTYFQAYYQDSHIPFVAYHPHQTKLTTGDWVKVCGQLAGAWTGNNAFGVEIRQPLMRADLIDAMAAPVPTPLAARSAPNPPSAAAVSTPAPTRPALAAATPAACVWNAELAQPAGPDNRSWAEPGETFTRTMRVRNSSTCPWDQGFKLVQVGGDKLGAEETIDVPPTGAGRTVDLVVKMVAPQERRMYQSVWQMQGPSGERFGPENPVAIQVPVPMDQPVQVGRFVIRAFEVNRQKELMQQNGRPYYAAGMFALVRLKVTYLGPAKEFENYSTLASDFTFSVHDDKGRVIDAGSDGRAGGMARQMLGGHGAISEEIEVNAPERQMLIAFDVPEDAQDLWLDLASRDKSQGLSIILQPATADKAETHDGQFIQAKAMVVAPAPPCQLAADLVAVPESPELVTVESGETIHKVWRIRNTSTCRWGKGFKWTFVGGDRLDAPEAVDVPSIGPRETADIQVDLSAPTDRGMHASIWQMQDPGGKVFGAEGRALVQVPLAMNQDVQIGRWTVRALQVNRQKEVMGATRPYYAKGMFALVRLQVTYAGPAEQYENYSTLGTDFTLSVLDDQGRTFDSGQDRRVGTMVRAALEGLKSPWDELEVNAPTQVLVAFEVAEDSNELWLNLVSQDKSEGASVHLRPGGSEQDASNPKKFVDAAGIAMPAVAPSCTLGAELVAEGTSPDNTAQPGEQFVKVWRLKNTGTCAWGEGFRWTFVEGEKLGAAGAVKLPVVPVDAMVDLKVRMTAPATPGSFEATWQMQDPAGEKFGAGGKALVHVPVGMNQDTTIGQWVIRAVEVNRQKDVWHEKTVWYADGIFALIRLRVTYLGPEDPTDNPHAMENDLTFTAHDDKGRVFNLPSEDRVGDYARWMVSNHAAPDDFIKANQVDYPVLIAFDVPEDVNELYLDIKLRNADPPQGVSIQLLTYKSKRDQTYEGPFSLAPAVD